MTPLRKLVGQMLLKVNGLKAEFRLGRGAVRAVDGVDFHVADGEILALVGESGSGKSATALSVMGLLRSPGRVTGGSVLFHGEDLLAKDERELRKIRGDRIAMIFQDPMTSLNPVYKVKDQIMESMMLHTNLSKKEAYARTLELLDTVGIPSPEERAEEYPHRLSGGMRQRVMIAMALACRPELLIADEPTTALDVTIQAQILELLYEMREKTGMAVLLITHDMGVVAEAADRVAVMYCGKIMESAGVKDLFSHPLHPYTEGLLASVPKLEGSRSARLPSIPGAVPDPLNMPSGCPFYDRCPKRLERCARSMPELRSAGGREVRCFLYENETEAEAAQ